MVGNLTATVYVGLTFFLVIIHPRGTLLPHCVASLRLNHFTNARIVHSVLRIMTDVLLSNSQVSPTLDIKLAHPHDSFRPSRTMSVLIPQPAVERRNGHLNLDTFSPVNQNGSFAFDKVLKSGEVFKRTRKTKVRHYLDVESSFLALMVCSNGNPFTLF